VTLNVNPSLSSPPAREDLVNDVLNELNQISLRDFQGALKRWHEGTLSLIHLNVLMQLRVHGPVTMSQLAEMLDVSVASATGIVDRMEKKGVIERRRSDEDRRVVEVHVTERGEQIFNAMQSERQMRLNLLINEMSSDELNALLNGLRAFRVAREKVMAKMSPQLRNEA
jgi:DNA-binding MarR family transcriptional regulator